MSFTRLGQDTEYIQQQETDNAKLYDFRTNFPRLSPCYSAQLGYLPEVTAAKNTALESRMLGLSTKLSRQRQENEWRDDAAPTKLPNCEYVFDNVKDRSNLSENNYVSDIILRRFEHVPLDYRKLAEIRRPSIGMDTRQYTKERWRKDQKTNTGRPAYDATAW